MKKLGIGILVILLVGCISLPKSEKELKTNHYQIVARCVENDLSETYQAIAKHTARCHGGSEGTIVPASGGYMALSTEDRIEGFISKDQTYAKVSVEHINPVAGGFLQLIEIESTEACPTYIKVYQLNDSTKWETATESVFKWINGDSDSCFDMF
ncbi:hypothetical protein [Thalassotalea sp. PS06]|uniref:hypothetical protein n=1 Tax=Thalassotalea sp. PS06 TaxID=2594005 RepID=UPI0011657933|nr:hypothetical protein [Thalassotalea sp. PS06]QDP00695.1 hypothetical protein FNC98_04610 [Thalassotalea sp. PS06]